MSTKTNKSVAKRFKVSSKGKLLRRKPGYKHFLRNKTTRQKRESRTEDRPVGDGIAARLKRALPFG